MSGTVVSAASRMDLVPFSGIRKVFERAKALGREGRPVICLETGRPDFDTPTHIKEAAKWALDAGDVHYTSNYGTPQLRAAIAEKLRRENGLAYDPEGEIIVTVGAGEAILLVSLAFLNPGDEVLYCEPTWVNYAAAARIAGATPVPVPLRESNGYQIDLDDVRRLITPRTRLLSRKFVKESPVPPGRRSAARFGVSYVRLDPPRADVPLSTIWLASGPFRVAWANVSLQILQPGCRKLVVAQAAQKGPAARRRARRRVPTAGG